MLRLHVVVALIVYSKHTLNHIELWRKSIGRVIWRNRSAGTEWSMDCFSDIFWRTHLGNCILRVFQKRNEYVLHVYTSLLIPREYLLDIAYCAKH